MEEAAPFLSAERTKAEKYAISHSLSFCTHAKLSVKGRIKKSDLEKLRKSNE